MYIDKYDRLITIQRGIPYEVTGFGFDDYYEIQYAITKELIY